MKNVLKICRQNFQIFFESSFKGELGRLNSENIYVVILEKRRVISIIDLVNIINTFSILKIATTILCLYFYRNFAKDFH